MGGEFVRFLRVRNWFYFLPLPLLSADLSAPDPLRILIAVGVAACGLAFAYGWNNLRDAGLDRSTSKNPFAGGGGSGGTEHLLTLVACIALALGGAIWLGPIASAAAVVQLVGSALYSGGPRLKSFPVVGTLTNLLIFCPLAFLCQGALPWTPGLWAFTALFGLVLVQNQLLHEAMDRDEDLADGVRTTATIYGPSITGVSVGLLGLVAAGVTLAIGQSVGMSLLFAVAGLPVTLFSLTILVRPKRGAPAQRRRMQRVAGMATCGVAWILFAFARLWF